MSASASSSSSSKLSKEGQSTLKVACQRCRSMKYRCPGPSPNTTQCSKCIKAGVDCVVEQHRRGRKLGTRLTDPEKALIRMRSAFDIIQKSKNVPIPSEVAAFFESSSAAAGPSSRPPSAASSSSMGSPPTAEPNTRRPKNKTTHSSSSSISPAVQSPALDLNLPSSSNLVANNPQPASISPPLDTSSSNFPPPPFLPPPPQSAQTRTAAIQLNQTPVSRLGPPCPGGFLTFPSQSSSTTELQSTSNQFDDIGPSSRPSISLASLFSLEQEDSSRSSSHVDSESFRQDPIRLGYLTEEDSRALFDLFMDKIDPIICYFDRVLYTHGQLLVCCLGFALLEQLAFEETRRSRLTVSPSLRLFASDHDASIPPSPADYVRESSQLLFTTILAIALKFSPPIDATTRDRVRGLARDQVLRIISDGEEQTVESVQALLLMTEFKEQDDRQAYFLLGMACRLAMDLNLGQPLVTLDERRNRNRIRAWLNAFSADRRFAGCGAVGSPSMMSEDWAVRNCSNFHRHPLSSFGDARLAAAIELRKLLGRYDTLIKTNAEHVQGPDKTPLFNLRDLFAAAASELQTWSRVWTAEILDHHPKAFPLELHLCEEHGQLQIAHHWLYQVFRFPTLPPWVSSHEDWEAERRAALAACLSGSCRILKLMIATPNEMLSYSPDIEHLFYSYATFFLLKMFKARILEIELFEPASIAFIFDLLRLSVAKLEECALDPTHTISLHLRLLKSILTSHPQYALASSFPSTTTTTILPPSSPSLESPTRLRLATGETTTTDSEKTGGGGGEVEINGSGNGGGEEGRAGDASSSSAAAAVVEGGGGGSDVGDISVFLGEDWSDLWLEGGTADTGELDFSFFDFAAPN